MNLLASIIGKPWSVPCDPPNSFDCWELVRHVRKSFGRETPSIVDRELRAPKHRSIIKSPPNNWAQLFDPKVGCVVRMGKNHVGVYLGHGDIIHSQIGMGVRVDRMSTIQQELTYWEQIEYAS